MIIFDRSVARSLGRAVAESLGRSFARSLARSIARSVARSLGCSIARSLGRLIARSLGCSVARSLARSIARSLARSLDLQHIHWGSVKTYPGNQFPMREEPVPPSDPIRFLNPTCKNPSSAAWLEKKANAKLAKGKLTEI